MEKIALRERVLELRIEILTLVFVLIGLVLTTALIWMRGPAGRTPPLTQARFQLLREERDAFHIWLDSRLRGRTLVHFGRHMPTRMMDEAQLGGLLGTGSTLDRSVLTDSNYAYAASRANLVRRIIGVVPDAHWPDTVKAVKESSVLKTDGQSISGWIDGMPINAGRISDLPAISEAVIINFSADYFLDRAVSPATVAARLRQSGIRYDLVTVAEPKRNSKRRREAEQKIDRLRAELEVGP